MSKIEDHPSAQHGVAEYISEMSSELAILARRENMQMVAYYLQLAGLEAFVGIVAGSGQIKRDRSSA